MTNNICILIGSPRKNSFSESLGNYLRDRAQAKGGKAEIEIISQLANTKEGIEKIAQKMREAAAVLFISPVYADSLPYSGIKVMEELYKLEGKENLVSKPFAAIIHCGFLEAGHNKVSLEICKTFVQRMKMRWLGGLMLGGTYGIIDGTLPKAAKFIAGNVIKSLDLTLDSILKEESVSFKTSNLIQKQILPKSIAIFLERRWLLRQAKENNSKETLYRAPYR